MEAKVSKLQNQPAEFTADNINNTESISAIVGEIRIKNPKAFQVLAQVIRQRNTPDVLHSYHFSTTGHPLNVFSEDWGGGLNPGYFEQFPYKSLLPQFITKIKNDCKQDPVTQILIQKRDWDKECRKLKLAICTGHKVSQYERLNDQVILCPKHLVDMAAHFDSDPEPYLNSSYNWYYAGNGNLQLICINSVDYLLHSKLNTVYVTQFNKSDIKLNDLHSARYDCEEGNNILETICSEDNIVAVRTKHKIIILRLQNSEGEMQFQYVKAMESALPFTSISFDKFHTNILYITTLNCKLTIVNLDRLKGRTVKLKNTETTLVDNWNAVVSSDRTTYTHAARTLISIYDKRTNAVTQSWHDAKEFVDEVYCNDISVVHQPLQKPSSLYFGTDHHVFHLDLRSRPFKPIQRWTHGMQCVPTYMAMSNFEFAKEIICLSSQWCEDTCVVVNYSNEPIARGMTVPYRPPSILTALHGARQQSLCFDLNDQVDGRLSMAVTGSIIYEKGQNYIILTQNSLGDISFHTLYPKHMESFIEDDGVKQLHEWCKEHKVEKKPFGITSVDNIADTLKRLKKVPKTENFVHGDLPECKFEEKEINEAYENELDGGLLDIWLNVPNETESLTDTTLEKSSILNLHYSNSD